MSIESKQAIENLGTAFEQFKAENDTRLAEIEKKGHADPLLSEKVDKINAALTDLSDIKTQVNAMEAAANRIGGGGNADEEKAKKAHAAGMNAFYRKGTEEGLRDLEVQAALTTQSDPDGGYLVGEEMETSIERIESTYTAMRSLAMVRNIGASVYKKPVNVGGSGSGWVGEEEARSETDTAQLKLLEFPVRELYANPAVTQSMLDDGEFDVEGFISDEVGVEFAEQEAAALILGTGVSDLRGILSYTNVANASYSWGNVGYVATGNAGAFPSSDPSDSLFDLQHGLKRGYRANSTFLMNDNTLLTIRKFKESTTGDYIWKPGLTEDVGDTLLGKRLEVDDNMPDVAANSYSIAYADFRRAYVIADRVGIRVLRDPYTNKPYVHFYTTKRVGGGIQNFEAIKLLKFAAS